MIKLLYAISLVVLISAGYVFALAGGALLAAASPGTGEPEISIMDRFRTLVDPAGSSGHAVSPLVRQATAYALYLEPPKRSTPKAAPGPTSHVPTTRPAGTTPMFRLLSTSTCRSSPEKSLALVSEPGKGDRWVRKNDRLGQFVVESIEIGTIIYRDGSQLHEIKIPTKKTVELARLKPAVSVTGR